MVILYFHPTISNREEKAGKTWIGPRGYLFYRLGIEACKASPFVIFLGT